MESRYISLSKQEFSKGEFAIVPIRSEDRYQIMKWRNGQMYHLRQNKLLTKEQQDNYFDNTVSRLFETKEPDQFLFSFLRNDKCLGYGGLVHVNWIDRHAEVSFLMDTELEKFHFAEYWSIFIELIERVAFKELKFHKLFTYAFDLRKNLYPVLEKKGYYKEAELKDHCFYNGEFLSVIIHSKIFRQKKIRRASKNDLELTFRWATDKKIRQFSFNKLISWEEHQVWFQSVLNNPTCEYYILEIDEEPVGSVRFDVEGYQAKVNYLIDSEKTGLGLGTIILDKGIDFLLSFRPEIRNIYGWVFKENIASKKIFEKLNFSPDTENSSEIRFQKELNENRK